MSYDPNLFNNSALSSAYFNGTGAGNPQGVNPPGLRYYEQLAGVNTGARNAAVPMSYSDNAFSVASPLDYAAQMRGARPRQQLVVQSLA